jgi:hypothetical protein
LLLYEPGADVATGTVSTFDDALRENCPKKRDDFVIVENHIPVGVLLQLPRIIEEPIPTIGVRKAVPVCEELLHGAYHFIVDFDDLHGGWNGRNFSQ